ncbi:MAG: sialate O-acetylesterase [Bacteroidota bacterium]
MRTKLLFLILVSASFLCALSQPDSNELLLRARSTTFSGYDSVVFKGKNATAKEVIVFSKLKNNGTEDSILTTDKNGVLKLKKPGAGPTSNWHNYVFQTTAPGDTTIFWVDNSEGNKGSWPVRSFFMGKWSVEKYYDPIADFTSNLPPLTLLATGQSNMQIMPYNNAGNKGDVTPDNRVLYWNGTAWVIWNIGTSNNLGFQFAKNIARAQNRVVRVILSFENGAPIAKWFAPSGTRFTNIRSQIAASGVDSISLILWRQGEAENTSSMSEYKTYFDTVMNRFKNESWFSKLRPVLVSGLCDGTYYTNSGPQKYFESFTNLDDPTLLFASNNGIYSADGTHFYGGAIDSCATRAAAVFLYGKSKVSPNLGKSSGINNRIQIADGVSGFQSNILFQADVPNQVLRVPKIEYWDGYSGTGFYFNQGLGLQSALIGSSNGGSIGFSYAGTPHSVFNSSGQLGVGTTSPNAKLHVIGSPKFADGTQGAGKVLTSDANGLGTWVASDAIPDEVFTATAGQTQFNTTANLTNHKVIVFRNGVYTKATKTATSITVAPSGTGDNVVVVVL